MQASIQLETNYRLLNNERTVAFIQNPEPVKVDSWGLASLDPI